MARIARFGLVGVASTVLYAVGAALVTAGPAPLMPPAAGSVAVYAACAAFSFLGHKFFTFNAGGRQASQGLRFALVTLLSLLVCFFAPAVLSEQWGWPPLVPVMVATVAIPVMNYLFLSRWVFSERPRRAGP